MVVSIKNGKLRGVEENGMLVFKGIPFAKAPIGELRFKAPVPVEPWEGIFEADTFENRSLQASEQEHIAPDSSEDCLNLNVWTSAVDSKKTTSDFFYSWWRAFCWCQFR